MKQDPAYLSNQSRALHRAYRRNRRLLNGLTLVWSTGFAVMALGAILDYLARLGWGFSPREIWAFLGFSAFGGVFWIFGTSILKIGLRFIRHTYGPDPDENPNLPRS